jgi:peptidoglycan/xylan/chitin deacetylase (PgdA/CDA1 family)
MNARVKAAAATCLHRSGALAILRRFQSADHGLVLMFHRVLPRADKHLCYDPHLVIAREVFEPLLELLAREYSVVSLAALLAGDSSDGKQAIAITFDDAWEDTYSVAYPLLRSFGFPATVFLCPELMSAAEQGAMLPEERFARIWDHAAADGRLQLQAGIANALGEAAPCGRKSLSDALKRVPMRERLTLLAAWEHEFATPPPQRRSLMTWDEARTVMAGGITLGSHTLRHCTLTSESDEVISRELSNSREEILAKTGARPDFLAYPNGACNGQVEEIARATGYSHAFTTVPGFLDKETSALGVPRLPMEDGPVVGAAERFHESRARAYLQLLR